MKRKWTILITLILLGGMGSGLWTNYAHASIVLKTMVVNPSQTKTQTAVLKAYLPKEAKPEDVAELGDLKIDYDVERGLYYVYKEFELAPGESVNRSIEIKDVWIISKTELEALIGRTKELVEALKETAYFDMAVSLQKDLEEKSREVLNKQERAMNALPQTHIAVYRDNAETFDSMKIVLERLEKMFIESRIDSGATEKVSVKSTWRLIVAMIIALGLLSFVFFIIWHRQAAIEETKKKVESEE